MKRRTLLATALGLSTGFLLAYFAFGREQRATRDNHSTANIERLIAQEVRSDPGRQATLVYLRLVDGAANVFRLQDDGREEMLTDEPVGVWDFNVARPGYGMIISALRENGAADLVWIEPDGESTLLLACPDTLCQDARLQPEGAWLAYEQTTLDMGPAEARVWLMDLMDGTGRPALEFEDAPGSSLETSRSRFPRWSPDGRYLALYAADERAIIYLDLESQTRSLVPANAELLGEWSPTGEWLVYTEEAFGDRQPHAHVDESGVTISHTEPSLYQHTVLSSPFSDARELDPGGEFDEGLPSWSPDGRWLAMARTTTGSGRQIWLVEAFGGESRAITDEPLFDHSALSWSPDGQRLAFMRRSLSDPGQKPAIWTYEIDTERLSLAVDNAYAPAWLP